MTNQRKIWTKKAARNRAVKKLKFEFRDPNSKSKSKEIRAGNSLIFVLDLNPDSYLLYSDFFFIEN
ncbi:MAG TPA: hypothetical protein DDW65_12025 [Firmicutes bacterium]|nr:hypothetical protein [Bacillota bacterium]